jgi:hypothetical protein
MPLVKYNPMGDLQKMERDLDKFWQNGWGLLPTFAESTAISGSF